MECMKICNQFPNCVGFWLVENTCYAVDNDLCPGINIMDRKDAAEGVTYYVKN